MQLAGYVKNYLQIISIILRRQSVYTITDVYLYGLIAFVAGVVLANLYFLSRKPKRDSKGRFVK